jgi:hypothetical protein
VRRLSIFLPVGDTPTGPLAADPEGWLPADARRSGAGAARAETWNVTLRVRRLARTVRVEVGPAVWKGDTVWRSMRWEPVSEPGDPIPVERLLPRFAGEIGLAQNGVGSTLVLDGEYQVPLGVIGEAIDAVALRRAARSTGTTLLAEIAARLRRPSRTPLPEFGALAPDQVGPPQA